MGISCKVNVFGDLYPPDCSLPGLVNFHIANWKIIMLLMGKSTISMAIFNSYVSLSEGIM